jgi:hypothetical protein
LCDAHPSFQILPILLLILCNGGLHQSSVLNFLLVKSGLWKTQSSDFSLKIQKSVTFCRFDQLFIENSTLVLQLGVFFLSRWPLGLGRRCGRQALLRRRRRLSPVVHRGMNCLHQAPRNVGAFVRCGPAYRKQRRAFALFHPLQR